MLNKTSLKDPSVNQSYYKVFLDEDEFFPEFNENETEKGNSIIRPPSMLI